MDNNTDHSILTDFIASVNILKDKLNQALVRAKANYDAALQEAKADFETRLEIAKANFAMTENQVFEANRYWGGWYYSTPSLGIYNGLYAIEQKKYMLICQSLELDFNQAKLNLTAKLKSNQELANSIYQSGLENLISSLSSQIE